MGTLSKRLVIRLSDDLDQWIGVQCAREGLDNATFVRAVLTRLSNGLPPMVAMVARSFEQPVGELDGAEPVPQTEPATDVDIEAMVGQGLELAQAQGLTEPKPEPEAQPQAAVRPLFRRPPPFSAGTQPGWIES